MKKRSEYLQQEEEKCAVVCGQKSSEDEQDKYKNTNVPTTITIFKKQLYYHIRREK